jgi:hypothetical protein
VQDEAFAEGKATAGKILAALYPLFDPHRPTFVNAADKREQTELIQGLSAIRSRKLDEATAQVFRSLDLTRHEGTNRVVADDLALACMDRLIGKGLLDKELRAYCEQRIRELQGRRREIAEDQRLELLQKQLRRIRNGN